MGAICVLGMIKNKTWFQGRLLAWFAKNRRDLPWRKTHDPYKILVSEIMLQQTQVDRVIPKYKAFLKLFPTVRALASASPAKVIQAWSGLGYNRRALYLKAAAEAVIKNHGGIFPESLVDLETLPGVGAYTARAIAAFVFEKDEGPVDTNISRVLHRWFSGVEVPKRKVSLAQLANRAEEMVPTGKGWVWNHAMMDFGALVCTAKRPKCKSCPMRAHCTAYPKITTITWSRISHRVSQKFENSNRYWRGKIIELLRHATGHSLALSHVVEVLGSGMTLAMLQPLLAGLVKDGLVILRKSRIILPR